MKKKTYSDLDLMLFLILGLCLGVFIGSLSVTTTNNTPEVLFQERFIIGTVNGMILTQENGNVIACPIQYSAKTCEYLMTYEEFQTVTGYFR